MSSTFFGIETAKRSLFTQQTALNTAGHNISNANTEGYSRQRVGMTAAKPMEPLGLTKSTAAGQIGTGVEIKSITRIRTAFLDDQFRNESKSLGSYTVQSDTLDKLQAIVNEPSDSGLRTVMDNFWKSWSDLSKDPENVTGRKVVRESALALTDALNQMSKQLSDLSSDLTSNVGTKSNEINSILTNISGLNAEIQRVESLGDNANDLRDQRDLLTDNLSKIVNITVANTPEGYNISMGGTNLVTGGSFTATSAAALTAAFQSGDLNNGEAYGMLYSRETYVSDYQKQLDTVANTIATGDVTVTIPAGSVLPEGTVLNGVTYTGPSRTLTSDLTTTVKGINGLHQLGYTFDTPLKSGSEFFTVSSGTAITAANIRLNPAIQSDAGLIATSLRTTGSGSSESAVKGNNTLAILMSQLKGGTFTYAGSSSSGLSDGTIDDYFQSIVGQMGVQASDVSRKLDNQQNMVAQVDGQRQSVSGVSLDEEMSDLVKFQHAYSAAARFMTTVDEMLDKLINGTGTVGR
ncbi:flagellar hook-associated protein FlgK [Paenibacillus sp. sptzw28]|uniref:flagellar hook-associated protein FlgK n=1 Tax=Paenibacillus sp. sptzw28 TaxID=715179 RepID=UPI001C6EE775|nr:flagellar hook-associated protein FlgK [Paenibacillus sp. sptzw28]QYR22108.1 flagellar hook-associated protein FlgK [Paenibacillus sp. sptzw28]